MQKEMLRNCNNALKQKGRRQHGAYHDSTSMHKERSMEISEGIEEPYKKVYDQKIQDYYKNLERKAGNYNSSERIKNILSPGFAIRWPTKYYSLKLKNVLIEDVMEVQPLTEIKQEVQKLKQILIIRLLLLQIFFLCIETIIPFDCY